MTAPAVLDVLEELITTVVDPASRSAQKDNGPLSIRVVVTSTPWQPPLYLVALAAAVLLYVGGFYAPIVRSVPAPVRSATSMLPLGFGDLGFRSL